MTRSRQHADGTIVHEVAIDVVGLNGETAPVVTAWLERPGLPPYLATAYVAARRTDS